MHSAFDEYCLVGYCPGALTHVYVRLPDRWGLQSYAGQDDQTWAPEQSDDASISGLLALAGSAFRDYPREWQEWQNAHPLAQWQPAD